jgi:O-antigen/teichoic acid export membrane protein
MTKNSLISSFLKGVLGVGLGKIASVGFGMLGLMVITRLLPPAQVGAFVLLWVIATFLKEVSSFGLNLSIPRYLVAARERPAQERLINTVLIFRLGTIVLTTLIALAARPLLLSFFGKLADETLFYYLPLLFTVLTLEHLLITILQGLMKFNRIGVVDGMDGMLNFILVLLFVGWAHLGIHGVIYAQLIASTLACAYAWWSAGITLNRQFDYKVLLEMLRFGLPIEVNYLLTFTFTRIDTFIINASLGPAQLAYYEIARKIPDSLINLYDAFRQVYFPMVSDLSTQGKDREVSQVMKHSSRLLIGLTLLGAVVTALFGRDLIVLLFSNEYLPSAVIFFLLMLGISLTFAEYTLGYTLVAIGESGKPPLVNLARSLVVIPLYLTLIPALGISGAAITYLVGTTVALGLDAFFLLRRGISVPWVLYLKTLGMAACLTLAQSFFGSAHFLTRALLLLLLVALDLFLYLTAEDLNLFTRQFKSWIQRPQPEEHPG